MFLHISYGSGIIAKNNATIDPLHENVQNLFQQAMVTSSVEAKKQLLDQVDVMDA